MLRGVRTIPHLPETAALVVFIFLGLACCTVESAPLNVRVLLSNSSPDHKLLLTTLRAEVAAHHTESDPIHLNAVYVESASEQELSDQNTDWLVTVGTMATLKAVKTGGNVPILSVLVPRVSYETIKNTYTSGENHLNAKLSAIFLDQPFKRRFALIRELLPKAREVAVVLGPSTVGYKKTLTAAAQDYGFKLQVESIENEIQLLPALERVLKISQVLLAILDPVVFNRSNAQTILLTSYRYRIPIIGISLGYTNAGALAAVYSTPEQIGTQLARLLEEIAADRNRKLPAVIYPQLFSISINKQIAHSLGIKVIDESELLRRLKEGNLPSP